MWGDGPIVALKSPKSLPGGPFDLASRVSKVGYGDVMRVSILSRLTTYKELPSGCSEKRSSNSTWVDGSSRAVVPPTTRRVKGVASLTSALPSEMSRSAFSRFVRKA